MADERYRLRCPIKCKEIEKGQNLLEIRLTGRDPRVDQFIVLTRAELMVPE